MKMLLRVAILFVACMPSHATTITLDLPGRETPQTKKVTYSCGARTVTAAYINTKNNQFAVVDLGDTTVAMVSVLSGSGARYVGQQYEWWTKGETAMLTDLRQAEPKPIECIPAKM
jgi:membrane-bound inhibitor of C-type lysozyme